MNGDTSQVATSVRWLRKALEDLSPDAHVVIVLDADDIARGEGVYDAMLMPDDSDGHVVLNLGGEH